MKPQIIQKHIFPSVLWFLMLFLISRIIDQVLHNFGLGWVGNYLGYPGTICILLSFIYSLRKKKIIEKGKLKHFLSLHEFMAWAGSLMILIHAGIHMHAIIPWVALVSMLIVVISGFTGAYLQKISQEKVSESREKLVNKGFGTDQVEEILYMDSLAVGFMKKWRSAHLTISTFFTAISLFHILSMLWFKI